MRPISPDLVHQVNVCPRRAALYTRLGLKPERWVVDDVLRSAARAYLAEQTGEGPRRRLEAAIDVLWQSNDLDRDTTEDAQEILLNLDRWWSGSGIARPRVTSQAAGYTLALPDSTYHTEYDGTVVGGEGATWLLKLVVMHSIRDIVDRFQIDDPAALAVHAWNHTNLDRPAVGVAYVGIRRKVPAVPQIVEKGKRFSKRPCDTTVQVFLEACKAAGFDPDDYADVITDLEHKGHPFHSYHTQPVSTAKIASALLRLYVPLQLLNDIHIGTSDRAIAQARPHSFYVCADCQVRQTCLAIENGVSVERATRPLFY